MISYVTSAGVGSSRRFGAWMHGGKPWSFWKNSGRFLYVFGDLVGDEAPDPSVVAALVPLAKRPATGSEGK